VNDDQIHESVIDLNHRRIHAVKAVS
jgi:hypothetical protein